MVGPWGGTTSPFAGGINPTSTPQNSDPSKMGWSVPAPPPYGLTMGGMGGGAYGISGGGAAGFGALIADQLIGSSFSGGQFGETNANSAAGGRTFSADYYEED